jgi:SAM-dependent methyltransferase
MALPFADNSFDLATMALVIFFVPEPTKGVAEMARVVGPGGIIATYAWDMFGGGYPLEVIQAELRAMNIAPLRPPSAEASRMENLRALWAGAGASELETKVITVQRTFASFDEFWDIAMLSSVRTIIAKMSPDEIATLNARVRERLPPDGDGRITYSAHANAIEGRVSK